MTGAAYVDVIAGALVQRTVKAYRARVEISVATRRQQSCLEESLRLREQVMAALAEHGIGSEQIEEGGGLMKQSIWSSSKSVRHELRISHEDMPTLVRAMAAVEGLFAAIKEPWFSGIRREFTFHVPSPQFADDDQAGEQALKTAVEQARTKAAALAQAAGASLGDLIFITEVPPAPAVPRSTPSDLDVDPMLAFFDEGDADFASVGDYTTARPPQDAGRHLFRVRFALTAGES